MSHRWTVHSKALSKEVGTDLLTLIPEDGHDNGGGERQRVIQMAIETLRSKTSIRADDEAVATAPELFVPREKEVQVDPVSPGALPGRRCLTMRPPQYRYFGRTSGAALAVSVVPEAQQLDVADPDQSQLSYIETMCNAAELFDTRRVSLPPPDLVSTRTCLLQRQLTEDYQLDRLLAAYFNHFNSQAPVLHRSSFQRALASGLADADSSFRRLGESAGSCQANCALLANWVALHSLHDVCDRPTLG